MRFTPRAALALGISLALLLVGTGARADRASATAQQDEQVFIGLINNLRVSRGLEPLIVHAELTTLARAWSSTMASNDQLVHSADMAAGVTAPWTVLGENVGVHGIHDIDQLFQAFVNSPAHYQNLVDPRYNYVGVGVFNTDSGKLWTTHRFMAAEPPPVTPPTTPTPSTTAGIPMTTAPPATNQPTTIQPTSTQPASTQSTAVTPTPDAPEPTFAPTTVPSPTPDPSTTGSAPDTTAPKAATGTPLNMPGAEVEPGPRAEPDVETVEQVLMELVKAGI